MSTRDAKSSHRKMRAGPMRPAGRSATNSVGSVGDAAILTERLTPRQVECLRWVGAGKTYAEIGMILSIATATVIFHVNRARQKLGVRSRTQAVLLLASGGRL